MVDFIRFCCDRRNFILYKDTNRFAEYDGDLAEPIIESRSYIEGHWSKSIFIQVPAKDQSCLVIYTHHSLLHHRAQRFFATFNHPGFATSYT